MVHGALMARSVRCQDLVVIDCRNQRSLGFFALACWCQTPMVAVHRFRVSAAAAVPAEDAPVQGFSIDDGAAAPLSVKLSPGPCGPGGGCGQLRSGQCAYLPPVGWLRDRVCRVGCPEYHGDGSNKSGVAFVALIRNPLRLPHRTWTACSSPRLMRCITVWRDMPKRRVASIIGR